MSQWEREDRREMEAFAGCAVYEVENGMMTRRKTGVGSSFIIEIVNAASPSGKMNGSARVFSWTLVICILAFSYKYS
jgi:hypothetical protein